MDVYIDVHVRVYSVPEALLGLGFNAHFHHCLVAAEIHVHTSRTFQL